MDYKRVELLQNIWGVTTNIIPGESIFDLDGINGIARFIRSVIEA